MIKTNLFSKIKIQKKTTDILVYKIAKHATAEMTTRNSSLLRQENAIIHVLVAKTKSVVLHGDFLSMDRRYDSVKRLFLQI